MPHGMPLDVVLIVLVDWELRGSIPPSRPEDGVYRSDDYLVVSPLKALLLSRIV